MSKIELAPRWAVAQGYRDGQKDTEERIEQVYDNLHGQLSVSERMLIEYFLDKALTPFWNKDSLHKAVDRICMFEEPE